MNTDLTGKNALVCGSTRGIGKAVAVELALLGANVTLLARDKELLAETLSELDSSRNQRHRFFICDFSDTGDLQLKAAEIAATGSPVHILVNNTGGPPGGPGLTSRADEFTRAFSSHLLCNHILMLAFAEGMKKSGYGRIINIISTSVKQPIKGLCVSNTIRAAVANWAKTISAELAPYGITVNNVLPGATMTGRLTSLLEAKSVKTGQTVEQLREEMLSEIPAGRFAEASEIACAVAFLATPAAAYINGINIPVDGGRTQCL